jgi:hypothetical protein
MVATDGNGTWGVNIVDDSVQYKTGDLSVKFTGNPTGTYLLLAQNVYMPCAAGDLLRVSGWVRSAEKTGDDTAMLFINWYTDADVYVSTAFVLNAELGAATTWEYHSAILQAPATAAKWHLNFGKVPSAEDIWWDSVFVEAVQPAFSAYLSADQAVTSGETVIFDTEDYDYAGCYNNATGVFTAPASGLYAFVGTVKLLNVTAGNRGVAVLSINSGSILYWGTTAYAHANGDTVLTVVTHPALSLSSGDTVEVEIVHNEGADLNADGAAARYTHFAGAQIR